MGCGHRSFWFLNFYFLVFWAKEFKKIVLVLACQGQDDMDNTKGGS